jgi:uncharacterized membrane protein
MLHIYAAPKKQNGLNLGNWLKLIGNEIRMRKRAEAMDTPGALVGYQW